MFSSEMCIRDSYKAKDENLNYEKELTAQLAKLQKTRQKYMDMYADDLISREELNDKIGGMRKEIERLENELKMVSYHLTKGEQLESVLGQTFKEIEDITDVRQMTNAQLKRIIQKIEVDKDGNVDIYLRLLGDLGLDETVLIHHDETYRSIRMPGKPNQAAGHFLCNGRCVRERCQMDFDIFCLTETRRRNLYGRHQVSQNGVG